MQIVIDIPEDANGRIVRPDRIFTEDDINAVVWAVYNGIEYGKVIEDIKAEIAEYKDDKVIHAERNEMIDIVLDLIDKHCGKENE